MAKRSNEPETSVIPVHDEEKALERATGTRPTRKARFEMRMPEGLKDQLERAAEASGVSATDIALRAIAEYSRRELEQSEVTRLNAVEARRFARALAEPPGINERLLRAIQRRRELIQDT